MMITCSPVLISLNTAMAKQFSRSWWTPITAGVIGAIAILASEVTPPKAQALGLAPVYIQLSINQVWGSPTLDLPPQRQRPELYAELEILDQRVTTPVAVTPRINDPIYPDWSISAAQERAWRERGHSIPVSIRVFDEDEGVDEKVLFSSLAFDPFACQVDVGSQSIAGAWVNGRTTCVVSIPDLRSESGAIALTLSAQWLSTATPPTP